MNKTRSILSAVILFILLFYLLNLISNKIATNTDQFLITVHWLNLIAYLLYLICGFIAGILSKRHIIVVGLIVGIICALSAVLIFDVGGDTQGVLMTMILGSILGGIGGVFSSFLKRLYRD